MDKEKINEAIDKLKALRSDENLKSLMHHIVGFIGELIVLEKLIEEGRNPKHIGGKKKYDIECDQKEIEVRTSSSRDGKNNSKNWGWTLKGKTKKLSCSHIVCVQLDDNYEPLNYLVIKRDNVEHFPINSYGQNDLVISDEKTPSAKFEKYHSCNDYINRIASNGQLSEALN